MALDVVQARVLEKLMRDLSYMDDLWKDDRSGRCIEEGRLWDDFDKPYLMDDKYTSVLTGIMGKEAIVIEEGNEKISWEGNCTKSEVPEINLNCSAIASKMKWEKNFERAKEGN